MPYGTPAVALGRWLVHTVILDRLGTALAAQTVRIAPFQPGQLDAGLGMGLAGRAGGYKIYGAQDLDIAIGDTFVHDGRTDFDPATDDGILLTVQWVSAVGWAPMDGPTMKVAYAEAMHGVGVA